MNARTLMIGLVIGPALVMATTSATPPPGRGELYRVECPLVVYGEVLDVQALSQEGSATRSEAYVRVIRILKGTLPPDTSVLTIQYGDPEAHLETQCGLSKDAFTRIRSGHKAVFFVSDLRFGNLTGLLDSAEQLNGYRDALTALAKDEQLAMSRQQIDQHQRLYDRIEKLLTRD